MFTHALGDQYMYRRPPNDALDVPDRRRCHHEPDVAPYGATPSTLHIPTTGRRRR
ncbi:hypothetical protein BD626DRAFT_471892 [Schizophyllum amplum]|uniref:Uncharacterized protein n=1 Tax=Schizophyllum amplum TaxID=97359 RepID=A0A550CVK4_9AGAR|nr:hypothetical protein BD626DRAFT_471892 [Auriculariopsis ampla]